MDLKRYKPSCSVFPSQKHSLVHNCYHIHFSSSARLLDSELWLFSSSKVKSPLTYPKSPNMNLLLSLLTCTHYTCLAKNILVSPGKRHTHLKKVSSGHTSQRDFPFFRLILPWVSYSLPLGLSYLITSVLYMLSFSTLGPKTKSLQNVLNLSQ